MSDTDERIKALEARLAKVEDMLEIYQLMMSHPPAIDTNAQDFWAKAWTKDAEFDRGPPDPEKHSGDHQGTYGIDVHIKEMAAPEMNALRDKGLCHNNSMPYVTVDGDTAVVTNYTQLMGFENNSFRMRRVTANRWELVRGPEGWKIKRRINRLMNGMPEARALLRRGIEPGK